MSCSSIQRSLEWCQGRPELPGIKRRIYYISKYDIVKWPLLQHDTNGRLTSASYAGVFTLRADANWKYIDVLADKSQLTSEPQGEYPSQSQLNKLVAVHPGVEAEASAAAAYLNNNDIVFLVEDMRGKFRVVGSDKWPTKTTVTQDLGQGVTGSTSTTINVEASDECPAPFYTGKIVTEEGSINPSGNSNQSNSGQSGDDYNIVNPVYNNFVEINGIQHQIMQVGNNIPEASIAGSLTSLKFTGSNMLYLSYIAGTEMETEIEIDFRTHSVATWSGNISYPKTVRIYKEILENGERSTVVWFKINIVEPSDIEGPTGD